MLRAKLLQNGISGAGHISGVVVVACLVIGWSRPAHCAEPTAAADEEPHLQLAPIKLIYSVGGNIGYHFLRSSSGASKTTQQTLDEGVNAGVGIHSFIWQPWLAQVRSQLSFGAHHSSTNSSSTPTQNLVRTNFEGDATLDLVKQSRFPFQARIYREDNRYRAFYSGTNLVVQTTGYSLSQSYTNLNRRLAADVALLGSKSGGPNLNDNYSDQFRFSLKLQPARYHSIGITGNAVSQDVPAVGRSSLTDTLVANHSYMPNSVFAVGSMVNLYSYSLKQAGNLTQVQQFDAASQQFSSIASLRPEKTPLTVTSSVRFIRADSSSNGIPAPTLNNSNFNLGANYLFSKLIRMYGSVNVSDSLDTQEVTTNAALTAAKPYSFKAATNLDDYRYSGSIGGSIATSNRTTTDSANQTTTQNSLNLGLYLSHALDKDSEFSSGNLSKHLFQSITTSVSGSGSSNPIKLNSGGALTWNRAINRATTLLRLSANDSRNLRGIHSVFQMINLQASRSEAMSSHESLRGSLTVQATHQEFGSSSSPDTITPSAEMNYQESRAFKVRNLKFESILRIADTNISPGSINQETRAWDNNFTYRLGRLDMRLNTHIAKYGNQVATSIMFSVNRTF